MKVLKIINAIVLLFFCQTLKAQEPNLVAKDISGAPQLDGTKLPVAAGWAQVSSTGTASLEGGALLISGGTSQQYSFNVSPSTNPSFEPTGDYTIEFRLRVSASTGRGFDMVLRDKIGRYSISIGTTSVVNQASSNALLAAVDGTIYHTYRFAVNRTSRTLYLYIDGVYKASVTGTSNTNCDLQLGKGENAASTRAYLDYVAYDLTAAYKAVKTYTATFESNGGSSVPSKTVGENGTLERPEDPVRADHGFVGWYKDAALTTPWDFSADKMTANVVLYARWDSQSYSISFNSNGGSPVNDIISAYYNTKISAPAEPVLNNFRFGGWYRDVALTDAWDFNRDVVTGSIVLYAKWNDRNQQISFPAIPNKIYGEESFALNAVASSGLPVTYRVVQGNVSINDGIVSIIGTGTATISVSQEGDAFYLPAVPVERTFTIGKAEQTITFSEIGRVNRFTDKPQLTASSSAELPLRFESSDPFVAVVQDGELLIRGLGSAVLTAYQDGDDNYLPAKAVSSSIQVFTNARYTKILVKEALSPNGDGMNDVLVIEGIAEYPDNRVRIVNRNGVPVYSGKGYNNHSVVFDGKGTGGGPLPAGSYFYAIEFKVGEQWQQRSGYLVIRY